MAVARYLGIVSGKISEIIATVVSGGASSAGNVPALDPTGRLDISTMPSGIGPNTAVLPATEAIAAGAFVNVWSSSGTPSVRNANASSAGVEAHGFVLAAVASGANATVYFSGINSAVSGQTAGPVYLGTTAGAAASAGASTAGQVYQFIGTATSATSIVFEPESPIVRS